MKRAIFDRSTHSLSPHQTKVEKPWGYEIIYTPTDARAVGKILHIKAGKRLSLQYHDAKTETLCLIKGQANIILGDKNNKINEITMKLNKGYFISLGQVHRVTAITDVDLIESSTPERGNTFRIEDDSKRTTETEEIRKSVNRGWNKK